MRWLLMEWGHLFAPLEGKAKRKKKMDGWCVGERERDRDLRVEERGRREEGRRAWHARE
jgi:hypothetical protein